MLGRELATREAPASKFAAMLPDAVERYTAMLDDLANTLQRDVARARYQLKELLGTVRLHPRDGYLEAELTGSYEGLIALASEQGRQTKINLVAGTRYRTYRAPPIFVPLTRKTRSVSDSGGADQRA